MIFLECIGSRASLSAEGVNRVKTRFTPFFFSKSKSIGDYEYREERMGYNGNNRKLRSSVIKKSSLNFGTKVVSNILAWPIAIATSAVIDSIENNETHNFLSNNTPKLSLDEIIPISKLTDEKYNYIKQDYKDKIAANKQIESVIDNLREKIKRLNYLSFLIGFITPIKQKLSKKVSFLEKKIKDLDLTKAIVEVDIKEIVSNKNYNPVILSKSTNVYLVFNPIYDYYYGGNMYKNEREKMSFFTFNAPSILSLNFDTFQIIFYDSVLVIATENDFAIVCYSCIKTDLQQIHILEDKLDNNINYSEVEETWLHTCLDGTPDLRYRNNPKVYSIKYWNLSINVRDSFNISLLFTDKEVSQYIYNLLSCTNLHVVNNKEQSLSKSLYNETLADLTDRQKELCNILKQIGFQPSKYITQKRPQFGSYVKRRRDQAVLCVIEITLQQRFICFDFVTQECYIYKKEDLLLY